MAKWEDDRTVQLKLPSPEKFIGISDIKLVAKLRTLFKSKISVDSVEDEEILDFFKDKFVMLTKDELLQFLELDIHDITEKIKIFEEFVNLTPEERQSFLETLEKSEIS
ncbi:MAG: hypothetical protein ACTSRG_26995 [Candidatus Helarchaeota archaeon]